jgi:hypothetical protein
MLLVVVCIGLIIYMLDIKMLFGPGVKGGPEVATSRPWLEEERIVAEDKFVEMPEAPKPVIDRQIKIIAGVSRNGEDRGRMELAFGTDGRVTGKWGCDYVHGETAYSYEAGFRGNVDVDVTYSAEEKTDKSLLYFIARGKYIQKSTQGDIRDNQEGEIFVTGYMGADYSASGLITITTDRTWSATYDWKSVKGGQGQ